MFDFQKLEVYRGKADDIDPFVPIVVDPLVPK